MVRKGKCLVRKQCCLRRGAGRKLRCKWVGKVGKIGHCGGEECRIRRVTKCSVRKFCCKGKKCRWVGKIRKDADCPFIDGHKICTHKTVGKCQVRKHCCKVNPHTKKNHCSFFGPATHDTRCGQKICRMMNVGACLERNHCCQNGKCFWEGHQRKVWNCNPQPTRMVSCNSYADPHMVGFSGNRFDAQAAGTFNLYSGHKLQVSYTAVKNGAWAAIHHVSVNMDGAHYGFGLAFTQPFGKHSGNGVSSVTRNGNKITCSTGEGEEIDIVTNGSWLDVYVRTNKANTGGICSNGFNAKAAQHPRHVACPRRRQNRAWCRGNGGRGGHRGFMTNCVFDLCQGLRREEELKIKREVRFQRHRKIHFNLRWLNNRHHHRHHHLFRHKHHHHHHHRHHGHHHHHHIHRHHHHHHIIPHHHHRFGFGGIGAIMRRQIHHIAHNVWRPPFLPRVNVFRPHPVFRPPPPPVRIFRAPPPPPIRIFRAPFIRRGKGDIWLQGKDKKWVDVNDVGTFNYLTDPVSKYSIDIQLTKKYKYATFVTGVAIKAKGKIILGNNKGEISIDGELVHHHAAYFDFNQDGKKFQIR